MRAIQALMKECVCMFACVCGRRKRLSRLRFLAETHMHRHTHLISVNTKAFHVLIGSYCNNGFNYDLSLTLQIHRCVSVCMCTYVRACVRVCVCSCSHSDKQTQTSTRSIKCDREKTCCLARVQKVVMTDRKRTHTLNTFPNIAHAPVFAPNWDVPG